MTMNKRYCNLLCALGMATCLNAQVTVELDHKTVTLPIEDVDLLQSDTLVQLLNISVPSSRIISTSKAIEVDKLDLKNEKQNAFNVLNDMTLKKSDNDGLQADVSIALDNQSSATLVLPFLSSVASLVPTFSTTGAYIFVNDKLWHDGDKVNFTEPVKVKVVSFNGDVRTYQISVTKTDFPLVEIKSADRSIGKDWAEGTLTIDGVVTDGMSVKGKGSHYYFGLKNNYALKFGDKKSLLNMTKNKRWLLFANESDNTLLRADIGYWLAGQLADGSWTPAAKPVNLSVNGSFQGCYTLVEQPRICKGRFEDGVLLSVEQEADYGDDVFRSKISNTLFVFEDPETGAKGTMLVKTKDKIDKFEKALAAENWTEVEKLADLKSFANWLVINEIAANADAFVSDTYIHVSADGKIALLPAWNLKKAFGCENDAYNVFVAEQTPWIGQLLKSKNFVALVKEQYGKVNQKALETYIEQQAKGLKLAAIANNAVWKNLVAESYGKRAANAYDNETERLKKWVSNRLMWLDSQW